MDTDLWVSISRQTFKCATVGILLRSFSQNRRVAIALATAAIMGLPVGEDPRAQPQVEESLLPGTSVWFGYLAHDGETVLSASSRGGEIQERLGLQVVHRQTLVPSADFGQVVRPGSGTVDGDVAVIGYPSLLTGGEVFIFHRSGGVWTEAERVLSPSATQQSFGFDLALDGDRLAIGDPEAGLSGEVYIYQRSGETWSLAQTLSTAEPDSREFGHRVALVDDVLVVGDPEYESGSDNFGSLFLYDGSLGPFVFDEQILLPEPGLIGDRIAFDGQTLVTSEFFFDRVRIFEPDGDSWSLVKTLDDIPFRPTQLSLEEDVIAFSRTAGAQISRRREGSWSDAEDIVPSIRGLLLDRRTLLGYDSTFDSQIWIQEGEGWRKVQLNVEDGTGVAANSWGTALAAAGGRLVTSGPGGPSDTVQLFERRGLGWRAKGPRIGGGQDNFGSALDIEGDRVAVGVNWRGFLQQRGDAFVYRSSESAEGFSWSPFRLFSAPLPFELFGSSIAISGDWIAVGNQQDDVWLYRKEGVAWLRDELLQGGDFFGLSVAIDGDDMAIGAPGDDEMGLNAGAVHLYELDSSGSGAWTFTGKIFPTPAIAGASFGRSLALEGDRLVVGANATNTAYVFDKTSGSWIQDQQLLPIELGGGAGGSFGTSVALRGDRIVVGAPLNQGATGAVHIFDHDGAEWMPTLFLEASDGELGDEFGATVAVIDHGVAVGAPSKGGGNGGVYSFVIYDSADAVDLSLVLADDIDPATPGAPITYAADVANASAVSAEDVVVDFKASPGLAFISSSGCAEDPLGYPRCTLGAVGAASSKGVTLEMQPADYSEDSVELSAIASARAPDASPGDEEAVEATQLVVETDLRLTVSASSNPVHPQDVLTLKATLENASPVAAKQVWLDVSAPGESAFFSAEGCAESTTSFEPCVLGWLDGGSKTEILFHVVVDEDAVGPLLSDAIVLSETPESAPGDEGDSVSVPVATTPFLAFVESQVQGVGGVDGLTGVASLVASPDGRFIYAASPLDREIALFSRDEGSCALNFVGVTPGASGPLAITPSGNRLAAGDGDGLLLYDRLASGSLSFVDEARDGVGVTGLDGVRALAFSADGPYLYAAADAGAGSVVTFIHGPAGLVTPVTLSGSEPGVSLTGVSDIAPTPNGAELLAAATGDDLVERLVVEENGTLSAGDDLTQQIDGPAALSQSFDGSILMIAERASASAVLYRDGLFQSQVPSSVAGGLVGISDILLDASDTYAFTAGRDEDAVGVLRLRPRVFGAAQQMAALAVFRDGVGDVQNLVEPTALAVAPGTSCLYVAASGADTIVVFEAASPSVVTPFFQDDFETGDTSGWSLTVP